MMIEEWRPILGFEDYEISDLGRVKSKYRKAWNGFAWHDLRERVMKLGTTRRGYCFVKMRKDNKTHTREVHRLVLLAFIGLPEAPNIQARHLDGNCKNNLPQNLCWGTAKENCEDKRRHGNMNYGERNGLAKLSPEKVKEMRSLYAKGLTHQKISDLFGITRANVGYIIRRDTWKHI